MESEHNNVLVWFAMRATYRREMIAKRTLEDHGIESFVPMRYEWKFQGGRRKRVLVPAIHNLIFVHAEQQQLQNVKDHLPYLQYMICKGGEKILVPDDQMTAFMAMSGTMDDSLTYLGPTEVNLKTGRRVKIHGGPCDGQEGVLVKIPGFRNRRVVVAIEGVMAVAMASVKPEQIELL